MKGAWWLGATHERSIFIVVLPAAKSGVLVVEIRCVGRAIGETMAVIMVAENQPRMPEGIMQGVKTLTADCNGNGICSRFTQRSIDCNCSCFVCIILIINYVYHY